MGEKSKSIALSANMEDYLEAIGLINKYLRIGELI